MKHVVETIITRLIKTHEYSFAQLLYEFQSRFTREMKNFENQLRHEFIQSVVTKWAKTKTKMKLTNKVYTTRLIALNEMRNLFLNKRFKKQQKISIKKNKKNISFVKKHLMIIRKFAQIKNHINSLINQ